MFPEPGLEEPWLQSPQAALAGKPCLSKKMLSAVRTGVLQRGPASWRLLAVRTNVGDTFDSKRKVEEDRYIRESERLRAEHHKLHGTEDKDHDKAPLKALDALIATKSLPSLRDEEKTILLNWRNTKY